MAYSTVWDGRGPNDQFDVSVIMALYKPDHTILRARLAELVAQLGGRHELVAVDDGSADGTLEVLREALVGAPAAVVATEANGGVARARNAALRQARGHYVWFVDWDDLWEPDIIDRLDRAGRDTDADIVACGAHSLSASGERQRIDGLPRADVIDGAAAFSLLLRSQLRGFLWSKLVRRSMLGADPFPPLPFMSDFGGLAPVLARAERVALVPDVLYTHVTRDGSVSRAADLELDCKYRCLDIVKEVAAEAGTADDDVLRFECKRVLLGTVNTAIRLGLDPAVRDDAMARSRAAARWPAVARLVRLDPAAGLRLGLLKLSGRAYLALDAAGRRLSRRMP